MFNLTNGTDPTLVVFSIEAYSIVVAVLLVIDDQHIGSGAGPCFVMKYLLSFLVFFLMKLT